MRFCFYSGYRDLKGGYTTLMLTLMKELHRQGQDVILINFKDGLIADELRKDKIEISILDLDSLSWKEMRKMIRPSDVFIATSFREEYRHFLKVNPRVVYFDINDFITQISDYKFGLKFRSLARKLIKKLLQKKSLVFMDDTGVFNLKKEFSMEVEAPVFLPIPVYIPSENFYLKRQPLSEGALHLTYIGRSVDWKMMPLKKILSDCSETSLSKKIFFSVVVDDAAAFRKFINVDDFIKTGKMEISVIENMPPSMINDFLLRNADAHFAMGTAALDAASLGVPTILVDYSAKEFPEDYRYKWLFETTGFSLGRNLEKTAHGKGIEMGEVLSLISSEREKLNELSNKSYNYVLMNHSVEKIASGLIAICSNAGFRLKDARRLVPYYFSAHRFMKKISGRLMKG